MNNISKIILLLFVLALAATVQAQEECERMLKSADKYYEKHEYNNALKMYNQVVEECGSNYGGVASKLNNCKTQIQEDNDYKKCTTVEACDKYLSKWSNGRYVSKVREKRNKLMSNNSLHVDVDEAELYAFNKCLSEYACEEYLRKYPNGKYKEIVEIKLETFIARRKEQERIDSLREIARELFEREAAKTAYMEIRKIEFANGDADGNILDPYNFTMYDTEIKYLSPRVTYDGRIESKKHVELYCKIISPDGSVRSSASSPSGYTYSNTLWVYPGKGNTFHLPGWGNMKGTSYNPGNYKLELWYEGNLIFTQPFTVKEKTNELSRGNWKVALRKCNENTTQRFDNGTYKGQTDNHKRSGTGIYYWNNGIYYIGHFFDNIIDGNGMYFVDNKHHIPNCPNCNYYVGNWDADEMSGTGSCYDKLGNLIYHGRFSHDKPTGTYPMEGNSNNKFECKEYSNGDYYLGETKNGKRHGMGLYIWKNGDVWVGNWIDGYGDGMGVYMDYQGSNPQLKKFE